MYAYIPKDEMVNIEEHLIDLIKGHEKDAKPHGWYKKLLPLIFNLYLTCGLPIHIISPLKRSFMRASSTLPMKRS